MKLAIPMENTDIHDAICASFGRAPLFLIYDTETKEHAFMDNAAAQSQGGAGVQAAQKLVDAGVDTIITYRLGENAAAVFKAGEMKLYKAREGSALDNIGLLKDGKLALLDKIHPGFHHHGGDRP